MADKPNAGIALPRPTLRISHRLSVSAVFGGLLAVTSFSAAYPDKLPPMVSPEAVEWRVASIFEKNAKGDKLKDQPRMNLSGAACVPTTPKFTSCLIANDEKKYAQFFSIDGNVLTPGKLIRFSDGSKDPDAEGVAYADGFFYVTGSHGRSRNKNEDNDSSCAVFRLAVDPATGVPRVEPNDEKVEGVQSSSRLRDAVANADELKKYFNQPLAKGGINIEGIAVKNRRIHFGLRAPSLAAHAFLISVDADAFFTTNDDLKGNVTSLELGENTGIRDLAAVSDGILILAGPTRDEKVPYYSVWLWEAPAKGPGPSEHST